MPAVAISAWVASVLVPTQAVLSVPAVSKPNRKVKMILKKRPKQTIRLPCQTPTRTLGAAPLRFTPYAWAKLLYLRDLGPTEVGGFGIIKPGDLLLVQDVVLVRQSCTAVTVKFDDAAVADFFDDQVDQGRLPEEFARIWIHTHPGQSASPSSTDEATFARSFGEADWAAMLILAKGGRTYARLRFSAGPGGDVIVPVEVDFSQPFTGSCVEAWEAEYHQAVSVEPACIGSTNKQTGNSRIDNYRDNWSDAGPIVDTPPSYWPWELSDARIF
jgi:proteasome lid subunit RPN8/RPN11